MAMTEQLSAVAMQQMEIIGTFLDAKQQLETQRLFQEMAAQAQKDYTPSEASAQSARRSAASPGPSAPEPLHRCNSPNIRWTGRT
jgi:hypothetical protein